AAAEASPALLRGPRERGDATEVAGEQLDHQIGFAKRCSANEQRFGRQQVRIGRASSPAAARDSSCGMSSPRGLSTMLSASVNKRSSSTKAIATPKRRPRAGLVGLAIGNGVTQATRRLAV